MIQFANASIFSVFGVSIAIILAFYVLRSVGLFILAKKNDFKHAFLAFIPIAWVYLAGTMVKEEVFFGIKTKKIALFLVILFGVTELLSIAYNFILYFPIIGYFLSGTDGSAKIYYLLAPTNETITAMKNMGCVQYPLIGTFFCYGNFQYPYSLALEKALPAIRIVSVIGDIAQLVFMISLFFNIFKKFWPEHFILGAIFSIFGFFPIFVFAIRNRTAVDYKEFIYQKYGVYPNGTRPTEDNKAGTEEPFSDFSDGNSGNGNNGGQTDDNTDGGNRQDDDPFSEFPDDRQNK